MDLGQARAILDLAHSAFVSMDEEGRIVYWNIRAEEMFGFTRAEAVGRILADTVVPERFREAHWHGLRRFLETGEGPVLNQRIEMTALRSDESPSTRSSQTPPSARRRSTSASFCSMSCSSRCVGRRSGWR
jgi:PAS domain-containing protein